MHQCALHKKRSQKYHKAFASRANACAWCQTRGAYYSSQSLLSNQPRPEEPASCLRPPASDRRPAGLSGSRQLQSAFSLSKEVLTRQDFLALTHLTQVYYLVSILSSHPMVRKSLPDVDHVAMIANTHDLKERRNKKTYIGTRHPYIKLGPKTQFQLCSSFLAVLYFLFLFFNCLFQEFLRSCQAFVSESSGSCQAVVRQSSGSR